MVKGKFAQLSKVSNVMNMFVEGLLQQQFFTKKTEKKSKGESDRLALISHEDFGI